MITSIPQEAVRLTSLSLIVGFIVTFGTMLAVTLGALWALSYGVALFLSHTSSVQLLIMLVVIYETYRIGQSMKHKRCHYEY